MDHDDRTQFYRASLDDEELVNEASVETGEQITERIADLQLERDERVHDVTVVDLRLGKLVGWLYRAYKIEYPNRRRRSNEPTQSEYLVMHAGKSATWLRKCYKAYLIITSDQWDETYIHRWDGKNGIAGIIKAAKPPPSEPRPKRRNRQRELMDAVWQKDWEQAEKVIDDWTTLS